MIFHGSRRIAAAAFLLAGLSMGAKADPLVVTDLTGRQIRLEKPAERVIVLPVPWASTVVAIDGGTDKLVAMHPEAKLAMEEGILGKFFPGTAKITTDIIAGGETRGFNPNVEAIAALKPDLVIQWGNRKDDVVAPLANAGIPTAAILYGKEEYARQIMTLLGTAMADTDKLALLLKWRDDTLNKIHEDLANLPASEKPKVAYFFYTTPEFQTEGRNSYTGWIIEQAGGINAADEVDGWGAVSMEQIVAWDPDVILLGSFEPGLSVSRIYDDPILSKTKAAKAKRVYKVPVGGARWEPASQESPLGWMWFAELLHPDRVHFDIRGQVTEMYQKIYGKAPTAAELDEILNMKMNGAGANYGQFAAK